MFPHQIQSNRCLLGIGCFLSASLGFLALDASAQGVITPISNPSNEIPGIEPARFYESNGLVVIEMENSISDYGEWILKTEVPNYTGTGYLDFQGNRPPGGAPKSALEFPFRISTPGVYFLHLHCAKVNQVYGGEFRTDLSNDAYVRVDGTFGPGPNPGNQHGEDAPLEALKSDTKFFGGGHLDFQWAWGNRLDLGGEDNKRRAVYNFPAGDYTLVVSGRSQFFKVNRIVFRHESVSPGDAQNLAEPESRFVPSGPGILLGRSSANTKQVLVRGRATGDRVVAKFKRKKGKFVQRLLPIRPDGQWVLKFRTKLRRAVVRVYADDEFGRKSPIERAVLKVRKRQ